MKLDDVVFTDGVTVVGALCGSLLRLSYSPKLGPVKVHVVMLGSVACSVYATPLVAWAFNMPGFLNGPISAGVALYGLSLIQLLFDLAAKLRDDPLKIIDKIVGKRNGL